MGQSDAILDYMLTHKSITPLEALTELGCFRLGARIWDLKHAGFHIRKEMVSENGKRFARYSIEPPGADNTERLKGDGEFGDCSTSENITIS